LAQESVAFYETSKIGNAFGKKCHKVSGCQPIRMYRRGANVATLFLPNLI